MATARRTTAPRSGGGKVIKRTQATMPVTPIKQRSTGVRLPEPVTGKKVRK